MTALPDAYDSEQARRRIEQGLQRQGVTVPRSITAAHAAVMEAPFADVTADGWAQICTRARAIAAGDPIPPWVLPPAGSANENGDAT